MREAHCAQARTAVRRTEAQCAQASTAVRFSAPSALRAVYWPTCLTDGHNIMVVNDHKRSAENWKCVVLHSSDRWQQCVREAGDAIKLSSADSLEDPDDTGITYIHIHNNITYIYIYRVYVDSHSLGQLALASKRTS